MESPTVERAKFRLQQLAAHLPPEQGSLSAMACMGGLRRDSRVHYARAASNDTRFMRPVQVTKLTPPPCGDSQVNVQKANPLDLVSPPLFCKPAVQDVVQPVPRWLPLFSRTSSLMPSLEVEKEKGEQPSHPAAEEQPSDAAAEEQPSHLHSESIVKDYQWFPRMDVVESGTAYVIIVELPGASVDGICCEVTHDSLVITGNRTTDWWKNNGDSHTNGTSNNGNNEKENGSVYHRREVAHGPYRAVWRLPKYADLGAISAEFMDGFLQVLVPKTRIVRYR